MDVFCNVVWPAMPRLARVVDPTTAKVLIETFVILTFPVTPKFAMEVFLKAVSVAVRRPRNAGPVMVVPVVLTVITLLPVPSPPMFMAVVKDLVPNKSEFAP